MSGPIEGERDPRPGNRRRLIVILAAVAFVLVVVNMVLVGYLTGFFDRGTGLNYLPESEILIRIPADAPEGFDRLGADLLNDVSGLASAGEDNILFSVGRFTPDGATFPDGLQVTWPLAKNSELEGNGSLHILGYDAVRGRWFRTGELATVNISGLTASGRVYHFSTIALARDTVDSEEPAASARPSALHIPYADTDDEEDETRRRSRGYRLSEIVTLARDERVARVYLNWLKNRPGRSDAEIELLMRSLYMSESKAKASPENDAATFKKVAHMIKKGIKIDVNGREQLVQIDEALSQRMAVIRDRWIEQVLDQTITRHAAENEGQLIRIGRSDTGNTKSGVKSDLDQTFYLFRMNEQGQWLRDADLDVHVSRLFADQWGRQGHLPSLHALDIMTFPGKFRFPDPRESTVESYGRIYKASLDALSKLEGAYTTHGAVAEQVQIRALRAIYAAEPGTERARVFQLYGPNGERPRFERDIALKTLFGVKPDRMPGFGFGAAVANFTVMQRYLDPKVEFDPKYHIRLVDDTHEAMAYGKNNMPWKWKLSYIYRDQDIRRSRNIGYLNEMFAHLDENARAEKIRLHDLALEISCNKRRLHEGGGLENKIEVFFREGGPGKDPGDAHGRAVEIFRDLGEEVYKERYTGSESQLKDLDALYRNLACEFAVESIMHSAEEAARFYEATKTRGGLLEMEGYRHLLDRAHGGDWDRVRGNMQTMLRLTILYALYDLGEFDRKGELLDRLQKRFPTMKEEMARLRQGAENAREMETMVKNLREAYKPRTSFGRKVRDHAHFVMNTHLPEINQQVQQHVARQLGYGDVELARTVNGLLETRHLSWKFSNVIKGMAFDPGNLTGIVNVMLVYMETDGDPDAVNAAILREALFAMPLAGQVSPLLTGDVVHAAMAYGGMTYQLAARAFFWVGFATAVYGIVDHEVVQPNTDNTVDAIYRGFIGPPTRHWGTAPAQFTDENEARLAELKKRISEARTEVAQAEQAVNHWERMIPIQEAGAARLPAHQQYQHASYQDARQLHEAAQARLKAGRTAFSSLLKENEEELVELQKKRAAHREHTEGPWWGGKWSGTDFWGGSWTGFGAQEETRPFDWNHYLFKGFPFVVLYSKSGNVDFRVTFDQGKQQELEEARRRLAAATDPETLLEAAETIERLERDREQYLRAQKYMHVATGWEPRLDFLDQAGHEAFWQNIRRRGPADADQELRYHIQRDSLYRGLAELAAMNFERYGNPATFIEKWWEERIFDNPFSSDYASNKNLIIVLRDHGLAYYADSQKQKIYDRFMKDLNRSHLLYEEHKRIKAKEANAEKLRKRRRVEAYWAQGGAKAVREALSDPDFNDELDETMIAFRLAAVKRLAPEVKTMVYMEPPPKNEQGEDVGPATFHVRYDVTTDPSIFKPPYDANGLFLTPESARIVLNSGGAGGVTLEPQSARALKAALEEVGEAGEGYFAVISVFASEVADLSNAAFPDTVEHLPGYIGPATGPGARPGTETPRDPGPDGVSALRPPSTEHFSGLFFADAMAAEPPEGTPRGVMVGQTVSYCVITEPGPVEILDSGPIALVEVDYEVRFDCWQRNRDTYNTHALGVPKSYFHVRAEGLPDLTEGDSYCYWVERSPAPDGPWELMGNVCELTGEGDEPADDLLIRVPGTKDELVLLAPWRRFEEGSTMRNAPWPYEGGPWHRVGHAVRDRTDGPIPPVEELEGAVYSEPLAPSFGLVAVHYEGMKLAEEYEGCDCPETSCIPLDKTDFRTDQISDISHFTFTLGGLNHGSFLGPRPYRVRFLGRTREFWPDARGVCQTDMPCPPPGETHPITVEVNGPGGLYRRTFTLRTLMPEPGSDEYLDWMHRKAGSEAADWNLEKRRHDDFAHLDSSSGGYEQRKQEEAAASKAYREMSDQYGEKRGLSEDFLNELYERYLRTLILDYASWQVGLLQTRLDDSEGIYRGARASELADAFVRAEARARDARRWAEVEAHLRGNRELLDSLQQSELADEHWLAADEESYGDQMYQASLAYGDPIGYHAGLKKYWEPSWGDLDFSNYQRMAEMIVQVWGDRKQAARYWRQSELMDLAGGKAYRSEFGTVEATEEWLEAHRPTWWPVGKVEPLTLDRPPVPPERLPAELVSTDPAEADGSDARNAQDTGGESSAPPDSSVGAGMPSTQPTAGQPPAGGVNRQPIPSGTGVEAGTGPSSTGPGAGSGYDGPSIDSMPQPAQDPPPPVDERAAPPAEETTETWGSPGEETAETWGPPGGSATEIGALTAGLESPDPERRKAVAMELASLGPGAAAALPKLIDALDDPEPEVRQSAVIATGIVGGEILSPTASQALVEALSDPSPAVRAEAAAALVGFLFEGSQVGEVHQALRRALQDSDERVRREAAASLEMMAE